MRRPLRVPSLFAALLLLSAIALSGCNTDNSSNASKSTSPNSNPYAELEPAHVDMDGYVFKVVDFNTSRWNREEKTTPYANAWHYVLDSVEDNFNCKIEFVHVPPGDVFMQMQPEVTAGGKYADIICATQWQYGYLMGASMMLDLNQLSTNWNNPWWNQNIRKISTINGKTYAANGSFIFDAAQTWLINYNEVIWQELQLPDPYEMIENGEWTIDRLIEYGKLACKDQDGSGVMDTREDRWGLIAPRGDFCRALYLGGGFQLFEERNGVIQMAIDTPETFDYVRKMRRLAVDDLVMSPDFGKDMPDWASIFLNGNALFFAYMPGLKDLSNAEFPWGVLPIPKSSTEQESYMSGIDHNSTVCGVTITNPELEKVGIILDAIGFYALELERIYWPDYEEIYWPHEEDSEVVAKYVRKTGRYDISTLMQRCSGAFTAPMNLISSSMYGSLVDLASYAEQQRDIINNGVLAFFDSKKDE